MLTSKNVFIVQQIIGTVANGTKTNDKSKLILTTRIFCYTPYLLSAQAIIKCNDAIN